MLRTFVDKYDSPYEVLDAHKILALQSGTDTSNEAIFTTDFLNNYKDICRSIWIAYDYCCKAYEDLKETQEEI